MELLSSDTMIIPYQDFQMDRLQCLMTVKVTIQCTAHPPVKRTGNFDYVGVLPYFSDARQR
ncbi:hypothetical protein EJJ36_00390 [Acinetobacter junii]|nr:hypothetical protein EJJ36_00390 [Acinetobacter junii]